MLLKTSFLKKQYFLQFSDFSFQVTLPTPETSTLNEASEAESKSTVIDPDETKNSDDEADKTIDDNTEDDSAVWIRSEKNHKEKKNWFFFLLLFKTVLKKALLSVWILALCWAGKIPKHWFNGRKTTFQVRKQLWQN